MKKLFFVLALGMFTTVYAFTPVANPTNVFKASKRFAFDATQISAPQVTEAQEANTTLEFSGIEFDYQGIYNGEYLYLVLLYGPKSASYLPQAYFWITKGTNEKSFSGDFTALQTLYAWGTGESDYAMASNGKITITKGEEHNYTVAGSFTYGGSKISPNTYDFNLTAEAEYNDESYPGEPETATTLDLKTIGKLDMTYLSTGYVFVNSQDADGNELNLSFFSNDKTITTIPDGTYNIANSTNSFLPGYYYANWETTTVDEGPNNSFIKTADNIFYLSSGTVEAKNDITGLLLTINAVSINQSTITAECFIYGPLASITATANDVNFGIVTGSGIYEIGSDIVLTATPFEGYQFNSWSDGNTDNPRQVTVTADATYTANFEVKMCTISVVPNNAEYGSVSSGGIFTYSTQLSIKATPNENYEFSQWSDGNTDNPRQVTATADAIYTAIFIPIGGTKILFDETLQTRRGSNYIVMAKISFGIIAWPYASQWFAGYEDADGNKVEGNQYDNAYTNVESYTVSVRGKKLNGDEDSSVGLHFAANKTEENNYVKFEGALSAANPKAVLHFEICSTEADGGNLATMILKVNDQALEVPATTLGDQYATSEVLVALPNEDIEAIYFAFNNAPSQRFISRFWITDDGASTPTSYTIDVSANNSGYGVVSGGGTFAEGATTTLTATPSEGYQFNSWSDGNTENPRQLTVTADASYIANFGVTMCTISVVPNNAEYGTVSGSGVFTYGTQLSIIATPNANYEFSHWSDGNTDNPRQIVVTSDVEYQAVFSPKNYQITGLSNNDAYGVVYGSGSFAYGSQVGLTVVANEGYEFIGWSDGNTDNPRQVTVTGNATYTAYFTTKIFAVLAVSNNNSYGTASGGGNFAYGSQIELVATPTEGYQFNGWSDGNTDNPRQVIVSGDVTYTALFGTKICELVVKTNDIWGGAVYGGGTFVYGTQVTISASENSGYTFAKWSNGETYNPYKFTIVDDMELIAYFYKKQAEEVVDAGEVEVTPHENSATIVWPQVDNTYTYSLIIWANVEQTEKVCMLTFNASGYLINIDFSKKSCNAYAQEAQEAGYSFTVTGLDSDTNYFFKFAATDSEDNELNAKEGSFKTTKNTATDVDATIGAEGQVSKIFRDGVLYILKNGELYNAQGARVE